MVFKATLSDGIEYDIPDLFLFEPEEKFREYRERPKVENPKVLFNTKELDI